MIWGFLYSCISGLEEVMDFLEQAFPNVEIAIAHGKVYLFSASRVVYFNHTHPTSFIFGLLRIPLSLFFLMV